MLYIGLRLLNLDSFPLFIDEAFTIARARDVWMLQPFGGVAQGKPLIPWVVALVYPFGDAVFPARAITLLAGLPGIAALIALGRSLYDEKTGLAAGLVYAMLPYTFFFGRFAMSDVLAANWGLVAAWASYQTVTSRSRWMPFIGGVALAVAIFSRLPMLVFVAVPVIAWLIFSRQQSVLMRINILYTTAILLLLPIVLIGLQAGDFGIGRAQESLGGLERIVDNAGFMMLYLAWYVGISLLIAVVVGAISGWDENRPPTLFAMALFLLPTLPVVLFGTFILPRYYLLGVGGLVLLAVGGIWWLANRAGSWRIYTGIILLGFLLYPFQRFIPGAYIDPTQYRLITQDQFDYVQGNTSGFGLVEAVGLLRQQTQPTIVLCSARVTCDRLNAYLDSTPHITISRTDLLRPEWLIEQENAGHLVLLAEDNPPHALSFDPASDYQLELFARFERPGDQSSLALYAVSSLQS